MRTDRSPLGETLPGGGGGGDVAAAAIAAAAIASAAATTAIAAAELRAHLSAPSSPSVPEPLAVH